MPEGDWSPKTKTPDILDMFSSTVPLEQKFISTDVHDECPLSIGPGPQGIATNSPETTDTRIWMIGRLYIRRAITGELGGRVIGVPINPKDSDTVAYCCARPRKDRTSDVIDSGLEDDIVRSTPEEILESYVVAGDLT